ncbi:MAG: hypothetical protein AAF790_02495 [Planctomycetota bacterium]
MARKAALNDQYRLVGTYERLRRTLLDLPKDGRLDKDLSFWVLPTDRRLPIAFLDRSLTELLSQPLEELMATPGVGQKKILGFFDLMRRVAKVSFQEAPFGLAEGDTPRLRAELNEQASSPTGFVASAVSEALWAGWQETIRRSDLAEQSLGRLAPTLRSLPTVIWHTPLSAYTNLTLAEMRGLRTHGEKRVQAILEVFCTTHEAISTAALHENLDLQLAPRFIPRLTRWLTEVVWSNAVPEADVLHDKLVQPMVQQVRIDLGDQVADLATDRLRLDAEAPSVKQQAEAIGVTRARVYQLLEDCAKVMDVRWPEGRWLIAPLVTKYAGGSPRSMGLLHGVRDLFFPEARPARHTSDRLLEPPKTAAAGRGSRRSGSKTGRMG